MSRCSFLYPHKGLLLKLFPLIPWDRRARKFSAAAAATSRNVNWFSQHQIEPTTAESEVSNGVSTRTTKVPVLIVGAGPVGLTLSILLSKYGIRSMVVERKLGLSEHPQAHFINNRTMEIFRKMDGLEAEIQSWQPPLNQWRNFIYCTTLSGPILGTVDHLQSQGSLDSKSPTSIAHFSQNRLLGLLLKRSQKLRPDGIIFGQNLESVQADSNRVVAKTSSKSSGEVKEVECEYLVATDGASSSVRRLMGVGMQGEEDMQRLISIHFLSKELGQYLLANQPGMLYFVFNTRVIAVIVAHNLQAGEFVAQIPYYPPQKTFEDFTNEQCRGMIRDAAGIQNLQLDIKTVKKWVMDAQVADTFICGTGRVILAGDAAHSFPPAGGFGMNTGIQDAHNVAWKLAAILKGYASPDLLSTYESERHPIAKANTALGVSNFKAATAIPVALGLSPSAARVAQQVVSRGGSWLPERLQGAVLDNIFKVGRLQMSPIFLNKFNPIGSSRMAQVEKILHEGRSLQLQFPAEDLGFRYHSGALVQDEPESVGVEFKNSERQRSKEYVPSSRRGARLPHWCLFNLDQENQLSNRASISTLDLMSSEKLSFLLIVGPSRSGCRWGSAALEASRTCGMPIKVAVVWPAGSGKRLWTQDDHQLGLLEEESYVIYEWGFQNRDSVIQNEECVAGWWTQCGLSPSSSAILVRPDDHIAWRTERTADTGSSVEMERVLKTVLRLGLPEKLHS